MNIFLTGATGFIGGHTLRALVQHGHEVTCLVREQRQRGQRQGEQRRGRRSARGQQQVASAPFSASRSLSGLPGVRVVEGQWTAPETWIHQVAGHEAVINTIGIIREAHGATFETVHTQAPLALFDAAARSGIGKVVQVSALGADEQAVSRYHLSKRAADQHLARSGVPYVVLRPSFVYGPGDHSMTFFARLAALPLTPVPGDGQYRLQPLAVADLVQAILIAATRDDLKAVIVDVGGGQTLSFDALLDALARRQGQQRGAVKLHIPWPLMRLVATATDALGGQGPITGEELGMLRRGSCTDNGPFMAQFGFEPIPFAVGIAEN